MDEKLNFFFIVKKEVICLRIHTVCWMDDKPFLCQLLKVNGVRQTDTHASEPIVPKRSAVGGGCALESKRQIIRNSSNFVINVSIRR
jgi:hypothetical protein